MGLLSKGVVTFVILFLLLLVPVMAQEVDEDSLGIFEQSTDVNVLQSCSNATSICDLCNITSIKYPNSSIAVSDVEMTKANDEFNYLFNENLTSNTGQYIVTGFCKSGNELESFSFPFEVTVNGNPRPDGVVVMVFSIFFLIFVAGLLTLLMYNIFHFIQWDFDATDLIINVSAYFTLFLVYILGREYLGNSFFNSFLVWMIGVTAFSNVILPIVAFVMSYMKGGLESGDPNR